MDTLEGEEGDEAREYERSLFHNSSKPVLVKNKLWKGKADAKATKEQQREADKNVAGIVYRSLLNQEKKAAKDSIGMYKKMFNF